MADLSRVELPLALGVVGARERSEAKASSLRCSQNIRASSSILLRSSFTEPTVLPFSTVRYISEFWNRIEASLKHFDCEMHGFGFTFDCDDESRGNIESIT